MTAKQNDVLFHRKGVLKQLIYNRCLLCALERKVGAMRILIWFGLLIVSFLWLLLLKKPYRLISINVEMCWKQLLRIDIMQQACRLKYKMFCIAVVGKSCVEHVSKASLSPTRDIYVSPATMRTLHSCHTNSYYLTKHNTLRNMGLNVCSIF